MGVETGNDVSITTGSQLNYQKTATPSTVSRPIPPHSGSVAICILDIHRECLESGIWDLVVFTEHEVSDGRQARDSRRKETW